MASLSQEEKTLFFMRLDELDELALENDQEVTYNSFSNGKHLSSSDISYSGTTSSQQKAAKPQIRTARVSKTTRSGSFAAPLKRKMSSPTSSRESRSGKASTKQLKKQRNKRSLQLQPEDAQIFRGLTFFFLPNNDIAPARKKRIEKAQEFGAVWARDWSDEVTHVIADMYLRLSDVKKAVGHDRLKSHHIIVNESYPSDCLSFKVLLPNDLIKFQILNDTSDSGAGNQPNRENVQDPGDNAVVAAVESEGHDATENSKRDEQQAINGDASPSLAAAEDFEKKAVATNFERQKGDELDIIVAEVQETADLPLDTDDESFGSTAYKNSSDSEEHRKSTSRGKKLKRSTSKPSDAQGHFSCMRKNDGVNKSMNPNSKTIDKLDRMAVYYDRTGDHWRTLAYRKCIAALKKQSEHITTREQAIRIEGIGERLADKVEEIALTNRLRRLESTVLDTTDQLLQLFMGIYQVGLPTASRWIAQGHKSLQDLKRNAELTTNQRIGLDHYDDFLARIPRNEVQAHAEMVREGCTKADGGIQVIVGGSYRRGAADCGDIDLILTKENAALDNIRAISIDIVIPQLLEQGFLKVGLATSSSTTREQGSKWHGASALPGSKVWRRIDFLFVPWEELGAALIYFTGNDIFNRSIRLLASRKQMRLNQHGLFGNVMRGTKRERVTQGQLLESRSEQRIFDILGVPWRPPEHRVC